MGEPIVYATEDVAILLGEDPAIPRRLRAVVGVAITLHLALFLIHFPEQAGILPPQKPPITGTKVIPWVPPVRPPIPQTPTAPPPATHVIVPEADPTDETPVREESPSDSLLPSDMPWTPLVSAPASPLMPSGVVNTGSVAGLTAPALVRRVEPAYPEDARRVGLEGRVVLRFTVDADGRVTDVQMLDGAPLPSMADAAQRAVLAWRYHPATLYGVPVSVYVTATVEFHIR